MKFKAFYLILFFALLFCSCKSKKNASKGANIKLTETVSTSEEVTIADEFPIVDEIPVVEEIYTTEVTVRTESVKPVDQSEILYDYYVIIGSFREISNARQYNIDLVAKGFSPVTLASENGFFRVSVGGYNAENAARAKIADIRTKHREHRDVWLLVRK